MEDDVPQTPPTYDEVIAAGKAYPRRRHLRSMDPEVAKAHTAEKNRRNAESRRRASIVLKAMYPDLYEEIRRREVAALDRERGPLPGDQ